jgi:tight adherence protein C
VSLIPYLFLAIFSLCVALYFRKERSVNVGLAINGPALIRIREAPEQKQRLYLLAGGILLGGIAMLATGSPLLLAVFGGGPYFTMRWLSSKKEKSRERFLRRSLLAGVEALWIPCDAGLSFRESVRRVAQKTPNPIVHELHRCYEEIAAGKNRETAYRDMVRRSIPEAEHLLRAVSYNETMGEPISSVLRREAARIHMEKRAKIQAAGEKVSSRIMVIILTVMGPPFLYMVFAPIARRVDWVAGFPGL